MPRPSSGCCERSKRPYAPGSATSIRGPQLFGTRWALCWHAARLLLMMRPIGIAALVLFSRVLGKRLGKRRHHSQVFHLYSTSLISGRGLARINCATNVAVRNAKS